MAETIPNGAGDGDRTLLITTRGFRDALRIAYQARPKLFERHIVLPELLYERVIEAEERVGAHGEVLLPLNEEHLRERLWAAHDAGIRSAAVVFMHGYRYTAHEQAAARLAREAGFTQVSVSHEVSPLMKLVSRGDTTVVDAYLSPILRRYVDQVAAQMPGVRLFFMQSSGGLAEAHHFQGKDAILSGPAGGIVGAVRTGESAGYDRLIGFDMGGTSTDVSHYAGELERAFETQVAGVRMRAPMMSIHTVAAGGGSILHFDGARYRVGPESAGAYVDDVVGLGHARLSIVDLEGGAQPLRSGDGSIWLICNGEVFNHQELSAELKARGHRYMTDSDCETIIHLYEEHGLDFVHHINGQFALALWDRNRRRLILARDRLGIKPLYFVRCGDAVLIASEIKQFAEIGGFRLRPRPEVVADYLATGYERAGETFFQDVTPLEPATWLEVDLRSLRLGAPQSYWFPERIVPSISSRSEAAERFRAEFQAAVRLNLRSDVPVGCALSGGLDSSLVAGCVAEELRPLGAKVQTFSVVFPGSAVDEQPHVEVVNRFVNAEPHLIAPTPEDFLHDLERFTWIHDEPVGGFAQHAAYALARLTRGAGVPVTLNGQGGDEILAGYWQSYFMHLLGLFRGGRWCRLAGHFLGAAHHAGRQVP